MSGKPGLAAVALFALAVRWPAAAQDAAPPAPGVTAAPFATLHASVRVGAFTMLNSPDSYDAVYGSPMPQVGVRLEARCRRPWFAALAADYGRVDGEAQVFVPEPISTGATTHLTLANVQLTAGYVLRVSSLWNVYAGLGPTLLFSKESSHAEISTRTGRRNPLHDEAHEGGNAQQSAGSSSNFGGHAVLGVRRLLDRWDVAMEVLYSRIPDSAGDGGATAFYGEDDLGGLALNLAAAYRF